MSTLNSELQITDDLIDFVKGFEGWFATTYLDPVGVPTIGWGTTGKEAIPGRKITKKQGEAFLKADLEEAGAYVKKYVKVPLTNNQYKALTSFVYNLGPTKFYRSTMLKLINRGNMTAAAAQFNRYIHGRDRKTNVMSVLPGLVRRREQEMRWFLTPDENASDDVEGIEVATDSAEHTSGVEPETNDSPMGALTEVVKHSETFKVHMMTLSGFLAVVVQLLDKIKENPGAFAAITVMGLGIGLALWIKVRDTMEKR